MSFDFLVRNWFSGPAEAQGIYIFGSKGWMKVSDDKGQVYFGRKNEPGPVLTADETPDAGQAHFENFITRFPADFAPVLEVVWIGSDEHERGLDLLQESKSAKLSLVDAVSFVVARDHDVEKVFAFDPHFTKAGFTSVV